MKEWQIDGKYIMYKFLDGKYIMYSTSMWPICESFDNVAVDGGALCVILLLFDE